MENIEVKAGVYFNDQVREFFLVEIGADKNENITAIRSTGLVRGVEIARTVHVDDIAGLESLALLLLHSDYICGL